jgi:outer membrane protein OmpA-like peptidoglycan-associated protein
MAKGGAPVLAVPHRNYATSASFGRFGLQACANWQPLQAHPRKDVLRPESDATLDVVAGLLRQDPALRLLVEGHTDATNTDAYNLDLSERRARAVVAALVKRGADGGRLQAKGFGKSRPVADNATAQGRALNRRVEVSLLE